MQGQGEASAFWHIFAAHCYDVRKSDQVIIDAGANVGIFALWAAQIAPGARIVCLEPHPQSFERLRETIDSNRLSQRVQPVQSALGGDSQPRWMQEARDSASTARYVDTQAGTDGSRIQVPCMTLPEVFERCGLEEVDLLKMDIECAEYETLLATPPEVLRRLRRINVELHVPDTVSAAQRDTLLAYLEQSGFALGRYDRDKNGYGIAYFARV